MSFTTTENIGTNTNNGEWTEAVSEDWFRKKEDEWIKLVGRKRWEALPFVHQWFLINTAGAFNLGFPIDIKKAYKYDLYSED